VLTMMVALHHLIDGKNIAWRLLISQRP